MAVKRSQKTRKTARKIKKAKKSTKQRKIIVKSSNSKHGDLGRLSFREYVITRRERLQAERLEYEKGFLARYKKRQKTRPKEKTIKTIKAGYETKAKHQARKKKI